MSCVWCDDPGYSLNVSSPVTVQEGLCVTIPCTFTYDASHEDQHATLYGYWYVEGRPENLLVATNNLKKVYEIGRHVRDRFAISDAKLKQGDCSLTVHPAEAADNNSLYYFRMEKGERARYDYIQEGRTVSLIVTEGKPDITVSGPLREGHGASIVCAAQRCSSSDRPTVTWTGFSEGSPKILIPNVMDTRLETRVDFIPSVADHRRNVTCKATYDRRSGSITLEGTITLNVSYAPRTFQFSGRLTHSNGSIWAFENVAQIVAQEGDSLLVRCKADGNPAVTAAWMEKPPFSTAQSPVSNNTLRLFDLRWRDKGKYTCQAKNQESSAKGVFFLQMQHSPIPCNRVDSICRREGNGYKCACSICSFPSPTIEWLVNGKIYEGNTTSRELNITSGNKTGEEAISVLHLLGEWKENTSVTCLGSNPKGQFPLEYQLLDNSGPTESLSLKSGVVGALLMFAVVMIIVTIAVTCWTCQKKKKLMTVPESYTEHSRVVFSEKAQDTK
ncbi:UNVERIFIED_CONTAM: hypothetical protein K2H54_024301, partial [Gekko kuhli]